MTTAPKTLAHEIEARTGQDPMECYQCGKCSAGCPVRSYADSPPNRVVRLVQLGFDDDALAAKSTWLCAGCMTCTTRCPQSFDLAAFMDATREIARERGFQPDADTSRFHKAFLSQIQRHGRAYELGLVMEYKLASGHLMQDVDLAPSMLAKGKLGLLPHRVKNTEAVRAIFRRAEKK
jgi:heterodisulfide reductase subunit C2